MRINELVWLDAIVDKLARKHGVEIEEVEEALNNKSQYRFVEKGKQEGEDVCMALGRTDAGRYLAILFIHKANGDALILSARNMANRERRRYDR